MRNVLLPLLSLAGALPACAESAQVDIQSVLNDQLSEDAGRHGIPAQAVLVLHNGEVVYRHATGTTEIDGSVPVTPQSIFPIFSVSKLYASIIALQLVEEGTLDLEVPASRYLPDLPQAWRHIQVGQFLSHVSGIPEYFDPTDLSQPFPPSLDSALRKASELPKVSPPGVMTRYTQTNYLVILAILESVTGTPYRALVHQRIIVPLGLRDTWLDAAGVPIDRLVSSYHADQGRVVPDSPIGWPDYGIAHAGIHATLDDLGRFLSSIAQGMLVSQASLQRFWRPYRLADGMDGYFASGWDYGRKGRWHEVGHDGSTKVRVRILFGESLDDHYVIVYLTNGNRDDVWSRTLVDQLQLLILPE